MIWIGLLLSLILLYLLLRQIARRIIFKPKQKRWPLTLSFQNIWLAPKLSGVYLPAKKERPTLLFFHGRGGNLSHFEHFAKTYAPLDYGILMADYPGFGLSAGKPSQKALEQTALATVSYALHTLKLPAQQLVLCGHSLGNYPALFAAHHYKNVAFKALVLQSPFLSAPELAATWAVGYHPRKVSYQSVRRFVTPFLAGNLFDNTRLINGLTLPVLVCMSQADTTLPWAVSAKLADGLPRAQRFLSPTGGHDEFGWTADAVNKFLESAR